MAAPLLAAWTMLAVVGVAHAAPGEAEQRRVWDDVGQAARKGPADVPLLDEAVLHVPAGEVFVPQPQADRLLNLLGDAGRHPGMPGLLLPRAPDAHWTLPVRFQKSGYVRDDDAQAWNTDEMLASLRDGAERQDRERAKAGQQATDIVGWSTPPRYAAAAHRLAWSLATRLAGARVDEPPAVDYNACALGRDGYFCVDMAMSLEQLDALGPVADGQLAALEFLPGKRYADFDPRSDAVAGYGLAALVVADSGTSRPAVAALAKRHLKWILPVVAVLAAALAMAFRRRPRSSSPQPPHGA